MDMEFRKQKVLEAVVNDYVSTAEPVGSRAIAKKYNLGVSPATIRNEMADLEDLGYLEQPHLSAGRIPSDKGYRYYVDNLVRLDEGTEAYGDILRLSMASIGHDMAGLLQKVAKILSGVLDYLVIVSGPEVKASAYRLVRLVPLGENRLVLVFVTEGGFVHTITLDTEEIPLQDIPAIRDAMYQNFYGMTVEEICNELYDNPPKGLEGYRDTLVASCDTLINHLHNGRQEKVFLGGASNLLKQPEFRDADRAFALLSALEHDSLAYQLLQRWGGSQQVDVCIGEEINVPAINDCSLVVTAYHAGGEVIGRIGVLGPRRMAYGKVMALVREASQTMSDILNGL